MKNLLVTLIISLSLNVSSQWIKQNPLEPEHALLSFDCINADIVWAVGDSGTVTKTTNGGNNWTDINLNSRSVYRSVKFVNGSTGFICGDSGKVFKTTDAGSNWFNIAMGSNENLMALSFADANTGYIAGLKSVFKTTNGGNNWITLISSVDYYLTDIYFINSQTGWVGNISYGDPLFRTTNGGINWTSQHPIDWPVGKIYFVNENTGWFCSALTMGPGRVNKTTNGGLNWISQLTGSSNEIMGIYFFDANTGWAVSYAHLLKTTAGGTSWVQFEKFSSVILNNVEFANSLTGYAIGTTGSIVKTTNGGLNWFNISKIISSQLTSVKFINDNTGFVIGTAGMFAKTTDSGNNWIKKNTNTVVDLYHMNVINENSVWMFDFYERLLRSTDQGETWQIIQIPYNNWHVMCFADENTGWIPGDSNKIIKTTNGGLNWFLLSSPYFTNLQIKAFDPNRLILLYEEPGPMNYSIPVYSLNGGVNWSLIPDLPGNKNYQGIYLLNQNTGWITASLGANYCLYKTTNSGLNWATVTPNMTYEINNVQFVNESIGFGTSGYGFFRTTNGGLNWFYSLFPYNLYGGISFINSNTGWAAGQFGIILKTTNAGGPIGIQLISNEIPKSYSLHQNFPNPFNPVTKIKFEIPTVGAQYIEPVKIIIYDILGREITTLINEQLRPGVYEVNWNATNYPSGVYFYKLTANEFSETKKMVLLK